MHRDLGRVCGFDKGTAFVLDEAGGAGVGHFDGQVVAECALKTVDVLYTNEGG